MANIGYARCSTLAQDLTAQRQALAALGVTADRVYLDKGLTGTSRARPGLDQALAAVREGDTLAVTKLDRLARSVPDALDILGQLSARGVRFALGGSVYDWDDPFARMFLQILAVIAEFEANLIRQRTREGMAIARQNGKLRGKQPVLKATQDREIPGCTTAATTTSPRSPACSTSAGPPCTGPRTHDRSPPAPRRHPARARRGHLRPAAHPPPLTRRTGIEVVRPLDGDAVTLRPCPPWWTEGPGPALRENYQRPNEKVFTPPGGYDIPAAINSPGPPAGARSFFRAQGPGNQCAHLPTATRHRVCRMADPLTLIRKPDSQQSHHMK